MLFTLVHRSSAPSGWRVVEIACRPLLGLAAFAFFASASVTPVQAGPEAARPSGVPVAAVTPKPTPKPKYKITSRPYIVAVGPQELDVKPLAGPRVRRPPLLPTPTPKPVIEPPVTSEPPTDTAPVKPAEPSAFSPDASPVLLPKDKPAAASAPEKKESVLETVEHREPELRDAVMYFDTPAGPRGSRASIPMAVPFTTPPTLPQPESRATYRKEKE